MTEAEKKAKAETEALVKKAVAAALKQAEALAEKAIAKAMKESGERADIALTAALDEAAIEFAAKVETLETELAEAKKGKGSKAKGSGLITAKAGKYAAKRKCYFGISMYVKGQPYYATKGELIPHHFKKVKDDPIETDDDYDEDDE